MVHPVGDFGFVDAHVHLYDLRHPRLRYSWLSDDAIHPVLGNIDAIKTKRYDLTAFEGESRFSGLRKLVHIQAALGSADPVEETRWISEQASKSQLQVAIIGEAHLQDTDVGSTLERHRQFPMVRGVRDFGRGDYWRDPAFERGLSEVERFGMLFDADASWQEMEVVADIAGRHPNLLIVLGHAGFPRARTDEYFRSWHGGILALAQRDNVVCKISGLGMCDARWTVASLRPWIEACLEAFGVRRCLFGTNWPVDRLYSSYTDVVLAYYQVIADLSVDERRRLFVTNAEAYYGF